MNDGYERLLGWKQAILSFIMLVGLIGWLAPTLYNIKPGADFEVEHLLGRQKVIKINRPTESIN